MTFRHIGIAYRNKRGHIVVLHPDESGLARICTETLDGHSAMCSRAYPLERAKSILRKRAARYGWQEVIADTPK